MKIHNETSAQYRPEFYKEVFERGESLAIFHLGHLWTENTFRPQSTNISLSLPRPSTFSSRKAVIVCTFCIFIVNIKVKGATLSCTLGALPFQRPTSGLRLCNGAPCLMHRFKASQISLFSVCQCSWIFLSWYLRPFTGRIPLQAQTIIFQIIYIPFQ